MFCGAAVQRGGAIASDLDCPGCAADLDAWSLDPRVGTGSDQGYRGAEARVHGCRSCGGVWVERATLDAMVREASIRAPTDARPADIPRREMTLGGKIVYRKCPRCRELMNRRNFARVSGIVVDECAGCGTYFDAGELEDVVAFVRAGGLALAKARREAEEARQVAARSMINSLAAEDGPRRHVGAGRLVLLVEFLRWAGSWLLELRDRARGRPR